MIEREGSVLYVRRPGEDILCAWPLTMTLDIHLERSLGGLEHAVREVKVKVPSPVGGHKFN